MPLVVPGITSNSGDKTQEWTNKLVGKKIADEPSNETVRFLFVHLAFVLSRSHY